LVTNIFHDILDFKGKRLAPEFDKAAAVLGKNDPPVPLVKVTKKYLLNK
jgi:hypothetical protein